MNANAATLPSGHSIIKQSDFPSVLALFFYISRLLTGNRSPAAVARSPGATTRHRVITPEHGGHAPVNGP